MAFFVVFDGLSLEDLEFYEEYAENLEGTIILLLTAKLSTSLRTLKKVLNYFNWLNNLFSNIDYWQRFCKIYLIDLTIFY